MNPENYNRSRSFISIRYLNVLHISYNLKKNSDPGIHHTNQNRYKMTGLKTPIRTHLRSFRPLHQDWPVEKRTSLCHFFSSYLETTRRSIETEYTPFFFVINNPWVNSSPSPDVHTMWKKLNNITCKEFDTGRLVMTKCDNYQKLFIQSYRFLQLLYNKVCIKLFK